MSELQRFIPLTKVDLVKREVWGVAAEEAPDKAGEIMDYAGSKPHFVEWSAAIAKATGGKSLGNLRAMHAAIAAGKLVHFEPRDAEKVFYIGAKVVDDQEWAKVLEGVYTGFSVGGSYGKRWQDEELGKIRYIAIPAEISLADNPAMYGATFEIVKANGMTERREFAAPDEETLAKFDLEERAMQVKNAFYATYAGGDDEDMADDYYVKSVMEDQVIVQRGAQMYAFSYNDGDGGITFGDPVAVKVQYVPMQQSANPESESEESDMEEMEEGEADELTMAMVSEELDLREEATMKKLALVEKAQQQFAELQTAYEKLEADTLEYISYTKSYIKELEKRIETLEAQPVGNPPAMRQVPGVGETPPQGGQSDTQSISELRRLANVEPNPVLRAEYNRRLIIAEAAMSASRQH